MASVWIVKRPTKSGKSRYRVEWRGGGREAPTRYGGSFKTLREAEARKKWFELEFASQRVPDLKKLEPPAPVETFEMVAERWRQSRVDVAGGTAQTHVVNLARIVPRIGMLPIDRVGVADVADVLAALTKDGLARESVRKTRSTAAMVLDFAGLQPNPARDKSVKLPREQSEELTPPTAD